MAVRTWNGTGGTLYDWSVAANWEETSVPVSTDEVVIPAGSSKITGGLNQSAVTLAGFTIEQGYDQDIGSATGNLQVGISNRASIHTSGGQQWIDFGSSNKDLEILATGSAATGQRALNIVGSNLADISITSGSVGIATPLSDSATAVDVRVLGGSVWLGENLTLTTLLQYAGSVLQQCSSTTSSVYNGTLTTKGTGTITTLNVYGGNVRPNSSGTITTLNGYGGNVDFTQSAIDRTVSTLAIGNDSEFSYAIDPNVVTISAFTDPTIPYTASYSPS